MTETAALPSAPELVRREVADGVLRLTLANPQRRNALSEAMMSALLASIEAAGADSDVRVVVIAAEGPAFSAGHDLKELSQHRAAPDNGRAYYDRIFTLCARLMTAVVRLPKPVIAEVKGVATAAGCQLAASCDLVVAGDNAKFATPGVNIGLFCSTPMVALSRAVGAKQAMEMLLLGEPIDAPTALAFGLVNRVVAEADLTGEVNRLAARIVAKSPLVLKIGKEAFYAQREMGLDEAYHYTARVMTENMLARDAAEGIDAFLTKRSPEWQGR
ncbi:MAG: enoyl-CoA hydratase [Ancalomicrobiaceae bacterium]|nr:enoyl-CoA hydratase [Ancalomicrobiaceae bacterium]